VDTWELEQGELKADDEVAVYGARRANRGTAVHLGPGFFLGGGTEASFERIFR